MYTLLLLMQGYCSASAPETGYVVWAINKSIANTLRNICRQEH